MVQSNSLARNMTEYVAYATQVSNALQTLLETTQVKIEPAVEFVSCGAGVDQHFVPKYALEKHLRKIHGERRPRAINNAAFYYGRRHGQHVSQDGGVVDDRLVVDSGDFHEDVELQSLVEAETKEQEGSDNQEGVIAAVQKTATSAGEFYEQVRAWQRIPRAYATMKDNERELVTSSALHRWLNAELNRPGVLPSGDPLDEELVEYVAGLLDHPDFCQPDLLVLELHEFLGTSVTKFVLALWKFMIVEIGLHSVFVMEKSEVDNKIQVSTVVEGPKPTHIEKVSTNAQSSDSTAERDYKRRRASYRGKVGTKTGQAAFREMIQKHMVGLSLETDRELVLGGGFRDEDDSGKTQRIHREPIDWYNFTDALEVRNRSRSRRQGQSSHKKRRSKSRSRSRRRGRSNVSGAVDHKSDGSGMRFTYHRREKSRSRSRSPRRRDSDRHHRTWRRRSASRDRHRRDYYR